MALQNQPVQTKQSPSGDGVRFWHEPGLANADIDQTFSAASYSRLSAAVRLVACLAAMYAAWLLFYPEQQHATAALLTGLTLLFAMYAVGLYWRTVRDKTVREPEFVYWIDALWYLAITVVAGNPGGGFAFFLAFPMLFVSLRWGYAPGIKMAAFSCVVLLGTGIVQGGLGAFLNVNVVLSPIILLVLGYLMATWANSDLTLTRRLVAMREFNAVFNPRYSIEQMIDRVVRLLSSMHAIDKFALVLHETGHPTKVFRATFPDAMYQVSDATAVDMANVISEAKLNSGTLIYCGKHGLLPAQIFSSDMNPVTQEQQLVDAGAVAARFNCNSFCSVQFALRQAGSALLVVSSDTHSFGSADLPFFHQLGEQLAPRIENAQIIERMASDVAEAERQKISRDIHDSAIQPYIGIKLSLEALARNVSSENPLSKDIARLVEMANSEISELRSFVKELRGDEDPGRAALVPALRRHAARFGELYGIMVDVEAPEGLRMSDGLASELFHMVSEGLSNIRRHTSASRASIKLSGDARMFTLQVTNPSETGTTAKMFTPRSIAERALALGGTCEVDTARGGSTVVTIDIPMRVPTASP